MPANSESSRSAPENDRGAFIARSYRLMRTIRTFEERVRTDFASGLIPGFTHLSAGQEAVAVGVCAGLTGDDQVTSTHRAHGHAIAKGCEIGALAAELFGRAAGVCAGKGGSMHIIDLTKGFLGANGIVGGGPPLALGAALAFKTRGQTHVSIAFGGDGSSNQGAVFEALNMAVVLKLPMIFVFENNGYGELTRADYAVGCGDLLARARAFGMPGERVDGTDLFVVQQAAAAAIGRARAGGGPSVIEAEVPRFFGHYEGDAEKYRPAGEAARLRSERDCLQRFLNSAEVRAAGQGISFDDIDADVARAVVGAFDAAAGLPPAAGAAAMLADVYSNYHSG